MQQDNDQASALNLWNQFIEEGCPNLNKNAARRGLYPRGKERPSSAGIPERLARGLRYWLAFEDEYRPSDVERWDKRLHEWFLPELVEDFLDDIVFMPGSENTAHLRERYQDCLGEFQKVFEGHAYLRYLMIESADISSMRQTRHKAREAALCPHASREIDGDIRVFEEASKTWFSGYEPPAEYTEFGRHKSESGKMVLVRLPEAAPYAYMNRPEEVWELSQKRQRALLCMWFFGLSSVEDLKKLVRIIGAIYEDHTAWKERVDEQTTRLRGYISELTPDEAAKRLILDSLSDWIESSEAFFEGSRHRKLFYEIRFEQEQNGYLTAVPNSDIRSFLGSLDDNQKPPFEQGLFQITAGFASHAAQVENCPPKLRAALQRYVLDVKSHRFFGRAELSAEQKERERLESAERVIAAAKEAAQTRKSQRSRRAARRRRRW